MNGRFLRRLLLCVMPMLCGLFAQAPPALAAPREFRFGVIAPAFKAADDEPALRTAIREADDDELAFVVVNGIKSAGEPCTDRLYDERKALLHAAKSGLIISLAASDWVECRNGKGKSSAIGRLNRLRDLFFTDEFSFGGSKIPVVRQSSIAKFRTYVENARWETGKVMFATLNLPANNNHYVFAAGRNSEFEDRLIANRDWLHRVFSYAQRKKLAGIVLFCDGNPLAEPASNSARRDGFAETRRYLNALAQKFPGKILVIHSQDANASPAAPGIRWRRNLGELDTGGGLLKVSVNPGSPALFKLADEPAQATSHRP